MKTAVDVDLHTVVRTDPAQGHDPTLIQATLSLPSLFEFEPEVCTLVACTPLSWRLHPDPAKPYHSGKFIEGLGVVSILGSFRLLHGVPQSAVASSAVCTRTGNG